MKKISVGSWAYTFGPYQSKPIPLKTVVEEVGKMGFSGISLGGFKPHAHPDYYPSKSDRVMLVKMIKDNGLEVVEYSPDLTNPFIDMKNYFNLFDKNIQFMIDCGFNILRLDTGCPPILPKDVSYDTAKSKMVEIFKTAAIRAAKEGIEIVWEFEPGFLFNKPSEVLEIYNLVDEKNFSILFDTCHGYMCSVIGARQLGEKETLKGGIVEFLRLLKGKIGLVHLIDSDGTLHDNETSTHAPFGLGVLNFDEIIPSILNDACYKAEWWVIDLCFWPDAWEVTLKSKKFVDELNRKYCG